MPGLNSRWRFAGGARHVTYPERAGHQAQDQPAPGRQDPASCDGRVAGQTRAHRLRLPGVGSWRKSPRERRRNASRPKQPPQDPFDCGNVRIEIGSAIRECSKRWGEVEIIAHLSDRDSRRSGLRRTSAIRPGYVYGADVREILGVIGRVDPARLNRVRKRLAELPG